jgi:hypothetical protein
MPPCSPSMKMRLAVRFLMVRIGASIGVPPGAEVAASTL